MRILLTGGTGLIGRALCRHWVEQGHTLVVLSRRPELVPSLCGPQVRGVESLESLDDLPFDAVINLAGAPIADRPWTPRRRALLWESRVTLTERLVDWLAQRAQRPHVLISGSAVGRYGDTGEAPVDESTPAGEGFAAELCAAWEAAAKRAMTLDIRVALIRTGLVLAPGGGFLQRLLPAYRLGLGGRLGDGRQWMPWIHLDDEVGLIDFVLHQADADGAFNACAPQPARNAEFSQALAQQLHRPARLAVPAAVLKFGLGEMSELLLGGQQALPRRAEAAGYQFHFTQVTPALKNLLEQRH